MATHYIAFFTRRYMGKEQAACGAFVDPATFSTEPTCEACREELEDDETTYARLMAEHHDPALRVAPSNVSATDGYVPHGERRKR